MANKDLKSLRNKIDKIDQDIYALIQKRASHAVAVGKIKSKISPKDHFINLTEKRKS
jgi:chorismate mutase